MEEKSTVSPFSLPRIFPKFGGNTSIHGEGRLKLRRPDLAD